MEWKIKSLLYCRDKVKRFVIHVEMFINKQLAYWFVNDWAYGLWEYWLNFMISTILLHFLYGLEFIITLCVIQTRVLCCTWGYPHARYKRIAKYLPLYPSEIRKFRQMADCGLVIKIINKNFSHKMSIDNKKDLDNLNWFETLSYQGFLYYSFLSFTSNVFSLFFFALGGFPQNLIFVDFHLSTIIPPAGLFPNGVYFLSPTQCLAVIEASGFFLF